MKDSQKKRKTRNYHLLRRVESWKCCRVTAFICPNCAQRDPNKYVKYHEFKKKQSFYHQKSSMRQFDVFPINDDEIQPQLVSKYFECGLLVFRYIHSNGRYGSARVGVSGPEER